MPRPGRLQHLFEGLEEALQPRRIERSWRAVWAGVSAIPDVMYPFDPAVLRAIHEFDQNIRVVTVTRVYKAGTGEHRVERRLALASELWNPRDEAPAPWTRRILTPTSGPILRLNHMDMHLEDRRSRKGDGLPGAFLPFDWRVYRGLRSAWQDWTTAEKVRFMEENDRSAVAARARAKAEEYGKPTAAEDAWLKERFAHIDKTDAERLMAKLEYPDTRPLVQVTTRPDFAPPGGGTE